MTTGGRIARLDSRDRRFDKAFEQPLDRFIQNAVLVCHRRLASERLYDFLLALGEGAYLVGHGGYGIQLGLELTLSVDKLHHAHHFALRVTHGHSKNRFRAVTGIFVELAIHRVLRSFGQVVRVIEEHGSSVQRYKAGDGFFTDVHRYLFKGDRNRVVLREFKAQLADRLALLLVCRLFFRRDLLRFGKSHRICLLDQVERTGVRVGDLAALGQDHLEQLAGIVLGAERRADLIQLVNLFRSVAEPLLAVAARLVQVDVIQRVIHHALDELTWRLQRQIGEDSAVETGVFEFLVGERDHAEVLRPHALAKLAQQALGGGDQDTVDLSRVPVEVLKRDLSETMDGDNSFARDVVRLEKSQERQPAAGWSADARFYDRRSARRAH